MDELTDSELELLIDKLHEHCDEGPEGYGWKSKELSALISKIELIKESNDERY